MKSLVALAVCLVVVNSQTVPDWTTPVVKSNADFKLIGPFNWTAVSFMNRDVRLPCALYSATVENVTGQNTTVYKPVLPVNTTIDWSSTRWIKPDGQELKSSNKMMIHHTANERVLTITNVSSEDKGIFHCHVKLDCSSGNCTETERWFKHGLNLNGPLYANLMDKYKTNFMIGGSAAGAVLGLILLLCLIYKFRYKEHKMGENNSFELSKISEDRGQVNGAAEISDAAN